MEHPSSSYLIARTVWFDFSRRKDFYVLLFFLLLFVVAALAARIMGVNNDSAARLLLGSGLSLSSVLSIILVALFGSRLLPEEFEARTLYPLLAKPVSRSTVLWAKFAGVFSLGVLSFLLFLILAWVPSPKPSTTNPALLAQSVVLHVILLAVVGWMVIWMSVRMPAMLAALVVLMIYFGASPVSSVLQGAASSHSEMWGTMTSHVLGLIPDLSMLSLFGDYVEGAPPLAAGTFLLLALYGCGFAALFALLGMQSFLREAIMSEHMQRRLSGIAIVGLLLAFGGLSPALHSKIQRQRDALPMASVGELTQRNSSPFALILGEFRASLSDFMFMKTERYLDSGIAYTPHINVQGMASEDARQANDLSSGNSVSQTHDEHHDHQEHPATLIRTQTSDFRGFLGDLEREIKPYRDPKLGHKHTTGGGAAFRGIALMTMGQSTPGAGLSDWGHVAVATRQIARGHRFSERGYQE